VAIAAADIPREARNQTHNTGRYSVFVAAWSSCRANFLSALGGKRHGGRIGNSWLLPSHYSFFDRNFV
jgi:hypothetical protein